VRIRLSNNPGCFRINKNVRQVCRRFKLFVGAPCFVNSKRLPDCSLAALKFCFKTCVAMKFVDDDDDDETVWYRCRTTGKWEMSYDRL